MIEGSHNVYFDNLFTSFPLLEQLSDLRNGDCLPEQAQQSAHHRKKRSFRRRLFLEAQLISCTRADQVLVVRKDNKAVYMAENIHGADMEKTCLPIQQHGEEQSSGLSLLIYLLYITFLVKKKNSSDVELNFLPPASDSLLQQCSRFIIC